MSVFTVCTSQQLPELLRTFRKQVGLTQSEAANRLGVAQQTYSALERHADRVSIARLLKLLSVLDVQVSLGLPEADCGADGTREAEGTGSAREEGDATASRPSADKPAW